MGGLPPDSVPLSCSLDAKWPTGSEAGIIRRSIERQTSDQRRDLEGTDLDVPALGYTAFYAGGPAILSLIGQPVGPLFPELVHPEPRPAFRFIDLFAGIGGIRTGLERAGGKCVYTVEFDRFAMQTYSANFGVVGPDGTRRAEPPRDIYDVRVSELPPYDVLAAGFPCQPFSLAGVSKKLSLGRQHGFEDKKSGNLFFEIARLIDQAPAPPPVLFLENVKHLLRHDSGKTFRVIRDTLEDRGYNLSVEVIDSQAWVPQHRERTRGNARVAARPLVLAPATAPGRGPGIELPPPGARGHRDEVALEGTEVGGRPRRRHLRAVGKVEAQPRGRWDGSPGGRVAERTSVGGVGIGGQLSVGIDLRLGAGPSGLVVSDDGRAIWRAVDPVHVADEPDRAGVGVERDGDAEPELRRDRDRGARLLAPEGAIEDGSRGCAHSGQLVGLQAGMGQNLIAGPSEHVQPGLGRPFGAGSNRLADEDLERLVDG